MEFNLVTDPEQWVELFGGTSRLGIVESTFQAMVAKLGSPLYYDLEARATVGVSIVEWAITFEDKTVSRIYPDREVKDIPEGSFSWFVGGNRLESLAYVSFLLNAKCIFHCDEAPAKSAGEIPF